MKVALITTNLQGGGAEKVFLRSGTLLVQHGHETHLLLLEHVIDHALEPGLMLHALTAPGRRCTKGFLGKRVAALRLRKRFEQLAHERPFDLVISTLPFADEVAALARLPRLWHRIANTLSAEIDRLDARSSRKARRRLARYRRLYGEANLLAVSGGVADDLRQRLGLRRANIERIDNPFDFAAIRRLADAPAPDRPDAPYVIHVGRFAPQKRHDLLLDAWRRIDERYKLVLLAHPDPALYALIRARGLTERVIVAGFQSNPYPWIKGAQLLVLCSDHEGMPNVLVEALACGTPVVSTDCPSGPNEILIGSLARGLVPRGDPQRFSDAIAAALRDRPSLADADLARFEAGAVAARLEALPARWRAPSAH